LFIERRTSNQFFQLKIIAFNHIITSIILLIICISSCVHAASLSNSPLAESGEAQAPKQMLSTIPRIFVKQFTFSGNTVVSSDELSTLTQPYTGKELTLERLEELRQVLIALYVQKGFVNSGVIIPDQQVREGVVNLMVIEGKLTVLEISGLKHFRESYISSRLGKGSDNPLNLNHLQQSLQLLQQDERIRKINAELQPGMKLGEAALKVRIEEESPYKITLRLHNDAAPSTGAYRGELALADRNLLGFGDVLSADVGVTEGGFDFGAGYTVPITSHDTTFGAYYLRNENVVIEEQYKNINIQSTSETFGIKLRQPLYKTVSREIAISVAGEYRESRSWLLGHPFTFSLGEHDGVSRVSVVRFGQEFVLRDNQYMVALNSTINLGISALGSTTNHDAPDSRFFSWLGQLLLLSRIGQSPVQVMLKANAQMAADVLLPLERFGIGGMNSVRGYRSNVLVRDNGVSSSLELRIPVINNMQGLGLVQLVPFMDFGWGWNSGYGTPNPDKIYGTGGGFRWNIRNPLTLEAYYGYGLTNVHVDNKELSDRGFHFQLTAEVF
jgi:hemolysin activation/secretion protein